jgi:hypothetical protein
MIVSIDPTLLLGADPHFPPHVTIAFQSLFDGHAGMISPKSRFQASQLKEETASDGQASSDHAVMDRRC